MSKFTDGCFIDFWDEHSIYAVSKEKYTLRKAVEIAAVELGTNELVVKDAYVRYGYYTNSDGERCNGWNLEMEKSKRGCPVWAFERKRDVV